jgi:hypothetical protein
LCCRRQSASPIAVKRSTNSAEVVLSIQDGEKKDFAVFSINFDFFFGWCFFVCVHLVRLNFETMNQNLLVSLLSRYDIKQDDILSSKI